jgi:hypothetical protein
MNWAPNLHMDMVTITLAGIVAAQQLWSRAMEPVTASAAAALLNPQFRPVASAQALRLT